MCTKTNKSIFCIKIVSRTLSYAQTDTNAAKTKWRVRYIGHKTHTEQDAVCNQ